MNAMVTIRPEMRPEMFRAVLHAVCDALLAYEVELNALDRAIGDGDHGNNMARAARALLEIEDELAAEPLPQALQRAGMLVLMSIGGASGPLYGSLLLAMGRSLPAEPDAHGFARAFAEGVEGVAKRGRSAVGEKTMLDVLDPAANALLDQGSLTALIEAAETGFETSRGLRAMRGRAAFVGARSIGHDDPGGASALLCIKAAAAALAQGDAA